MCFTKRVARAIRKFLKYVLRTYKKEIMTFVSNEIDKRIAEVQFHVNAEVKKKIHNELVAYILTNQVDIHTSAGAETVKTMLSDFIDKLEGGS